MGARATDPMRYRFERKFLVTDLGPSEVESLVRLLPGVFREVYPPRSVNNIYLDTADAMHYRHNQDGLADRVKVRVRWYGELLGQVDKPVLELKIKRGLLGRKEAFPITPFSIVPGFDINHLMLALAESSLPKEVEEALASLFPALLNRYTRKYFLSADGHVRLTLDTDREFYQLRARHNLLIARFPEARATVLELKYSPEHDHLAAEVSKSFPFRLTKSSKYVQGIEQSSWA